MYEQSTYCVIIKHNKYSTVVTLYRFDMAAESYDSCCRYTVTSEQFGMIRLSVGGRV